jgi:hypothetical protein
MTPQESSETTVFLNSVSSDGSIRIFAISAEATEKPSFNLSENTCFSYSPEVRLTADGRSGMRMGVDCPKNPVGL